MKKACIAGGLTGFGTTLSLFAVYRTGRLDWPETFLVLGIAVFTAGLVLGAQVIKEICERCGED